MIYLFPCNSNRDKLTSLKIQLLRSRFSQVTDWLQLAQGLLSNMPAPQNQACEIFSDILGPDTMDETYGAFVPAFMKSSTYNFSFGVWAGPHRLNRIDPCTLPGVNCTESSYANAGKILYRAIWRNLRWTSWSYGHTRVLASSSVLQLEHLYFGIFPAIKFKSVDGTWLPKTARALNLSPSLPT